MHVTRLTTALATAGFVALLTGRSGGSLPLPAVGHGGEAAQSATGGLLIGPPLLSARQSEARFDRPVATKAGLPSVRYLHCAKPAVYLFASEVISGNVYEYCENPTAQHITYTAPAPGYGGWGLAVSPVPTGPGAPNEKIAIGSWPVNSTTPGTIAVRTVGAGGLLGAAPVATLTLGPNGFSALGICFDGSGGLYATDAFPSNGKILLSNEVDYFTNAQVAGGPPFGAPTSIWYMTTAPNQPFFGAYLACDFDMLSAGENFVMIDGVDSNSNVDVGQLTAGVVTVNQNLGSDASHYPGGMTINRYDYLVVNDATGVLIDLGGAEPWKFPPVNQCRYNYPTTSYLPIVFDDTQYEIWAGNTVNLVADAVSNVYRFPPGGNGPCITPAESGGPTALITNSYFLGIAVWRNSGV